MRTSPFIVPPFGTTPLDEQALFPFKGVVATTADLPLTGNAQNDTWIVSADDRAYTWNNSSPTGTIDKWVDIGVVSSIAWANVTGKPTSAVADIDSAVSARHAHELTKTYYVDSGRVDTYTEDGTLAKPYKTIQGAVDAVAALGLSAYITIDIAGGIYAENVVLENAGLKYVKLRGNGYVSVNPASGNALQSAATNDNLVALFIKNIIFAKPVVLTGANGAASFADVMLTDVSFTGTATLTATCLNNISFKDVYAETAFAFNNVVWSYMEGGQLQGTFTASMDSTADCPSGGSNGTVLANGIFLSGTAAYAVAGTSTYTVAINGCRWGNAAVTLPAGVSILAYNSFMRGTHTNNGAITLHNASVEGYTAGTGTLTITGQPASLIANTPAGTIAATNVQDALNELDIEKPTISSGSGAPSSTPAKIGDIYVDTAGPALYFAKGITSSADWIAS